MRLEEFTSKNCAIFFKFKNNSALLKNENFNKINKHKNFRGFELQVTKNGAFFDAGC